jgi:hypothetical protein
VFHLVNQKYHLALRDEEIAHCSSQIQQSTRLERAQEFGDFLQKKEILGDSGKVDAKQ